ncbi:MAG: GAF domain-containing protein [Leptolyngbyaceae cyanobacterium SL_7_1]|nr:GAF domain-containing protein [Leptolyngbyaceae cyanobacterium SL_7_1]
MTLPGDSPLPLTLFSVSPIAQARNGHSPVDESSLIFVQDAAGRYLSFCWQQAERYGIESVRLIGNLMNATGNTFHPVSIALYLQRVQQLLEQQIGGRFVYPFYSTGRYLVFELNISPILTFHQPSSHAVVIGKFLYDCSKEQAYELVNSLDLYPIGTSDTHHHKLLTQISWNIRRTLELETIWQQTVNGLGEALSVSRCLICPYEPGNSTLKVVAEYRQPAVQSMRGMELTIAEEPHLRQVLTTLKPVTVTVTQSPLNDPLYSLLAIATCHQDQPNGIILLHQFDRSRLWNEIQIEQIRELADQVGTGIAHATLFADMNNLTAELQRANERLIRQHEAVEEARQQAEEASRLKSEFLANTSHELRTPLNGMIGFLKLVMDGMADDPVEQGEFIEEAHRSAVHLLNIINDILDIAKIEAGKMQLDLDPVKLDDLLTDVENFIRPQAQQKNLSLVILTPATRDEIILCGNYQRLLQVMLNLLSNAIKFTHEGGVTISAEVIPEKVVVQNQELPGFVKISVADTGIGVSLEKQDKLFQSFSQVDGSRTRQYGGTGLGLAISQKLVEAMGGIVNFFSLGEGLGSTVTFTIPLYQDPVMIAALPESTADLLV